MASHFSILALRTHERMKKQKGMTLKDEPPRSVGVQYTTGEKWRRKNEEPESKQKTIPSCGYV